VTGTLPEPLRQQPHQQCLPQQLRNVSHAQASHQVEPVNLDGPHADLQGISDLTVGQALRDETQDFSLSWSQVIADSFSSVTSWHTLRGADPGHR
jgi:hypothetical protein